MLICACTHFTFSLTSNFLNPTHRISHPIRQLYLCLCDHRKQHYYNATLSHMQNCRFSCALPLLLTLLSFTLSHLHCLPFSPLFSGLLCPFYHGTCCFLYICFPGSVSCYLTQKENPFLCVLSLFSQPSIIHILRTLYWC